jgi:hypothetical protein
LGTGFAIDLQPGRLRRADLIHRLLGGDMHDQHRHVDQARQGDRTPGRFALSYSRMTDRVVSRLHMAAIDQALP